jgi:tRNA(adenine34) deaminase
MTEHIHATRFDLSLPDWAAAELATHTAAPFTTVEERVRLTIALARKNFELDTGGPFGAAVFDDDTGRLVSIGVNRVVPMGCSTAHAEVMALRSAAAVTGDGWRLTGCTLVVTLEPCTMCAGAAVLARLDRLVYGADDPKAGAVTSLWDVVRDGRLNHRPEVVGGVLADESAELLREFFASRRAGPLR